MIFPLSGSMTWRPAGPWHPSQPVFPAGRFAMATDLKCGLRGKVVPDRRMAALADPAAQELLAGWPVLLVERTQDVAVGRPLDLREVYEGGNQGHQNDSGCGRGHAGQAGHDAS